MGRWVAVALSCFLVTGVGARAYAQDARDASYAFEGNSLRITRGGSSATVDLGCVGRTTLRVGNQLFVACGSGGVVEVDVSDPLAPSRGATMPVDGDATGLFLRDGRAWVEVSHVDARPVRIAPSSTLAERANAATATATTATTTSSASLPPVTWTPTTPQVAPVRGPASAGDEAERPPIEVKETPSMIAPPRRAGLWDMGFLTSVFVPFGSLGIGQLGSASVTYRFEAPIMVRAQVAPFGIAGPATTNNSGIPSASGGFAGSVPGGPPPQPQPTPTPPPTPGPANGGAVTVLAAHMIVGLDTQFLEVGLGLGGATVNENSNAPFNSGTGAPQTAAVSIVEETRIGARDGLALNMESSAIAVHSKFDLGYFIASLQIPVSMKAMLVVRGGGGNVGFALGDLGVRVLVQGDGGKRTLALTGFAGGARIGLNLCSSNPDPPFTSACNSANLVGPSIGGGVEWKQ